MPKFYIMIDQKYFSWNFFWGAHPSPTPMAGPQASHHLNPALKIITVTKVGLTTQKCTKFYHSAESQTIVT